MTKRIIAGAMMVALWVGVIAFAGCGENRKKDEDAAAVANGGVAAADGDGTVTGVGADATEGATEAGEDLFFGVASDKEAAKVVISKEAMTLTVLDADGGTVARFPIAAGLNYGNKRKSGDKKTPEGTFEVQQIQDASTWTHDFGDGKGEIKGAYGSHFVRLLTPPHRGIGIHGTHDPASIGTRATEGCIRLHNEDLLEFVEMVRVGLPVEITTSEKDRAVDEGGPF